MFYRIFYPCGRFSDCRDKISGVMETRLIRELDTMLIQSYVKLDCNQLYSSKVQSLFQDVS
jgi:hypothetical protein